MGHALGDPGCICGLRGNCEGPPNKGSKLIVLKNSQQSQSAFPFFLKTCMCNAASEVQDLGKLNQPALWVDLSAAMCKVEVSFMVTTAQVL